MQLVDRFLKSCYVHTGTMATASGMHDSIYDQEQDKTAEPEAIVSTTVGLEGNRSSSSTARLGNSRILLTLLC